MGGICKEGELEGAKDNHKYTPISIYFEEPPDNFALPRENQPSEHLSQYKAIDAALLLRYHY